MKRQFDNYNTNLVCFIPRLLCGMAEPVDTRIPARRRVHQRNHPRHRLSVPEGERHPCDGRRCQPSHLFLLPAGPQHPHVHRCQVAPALKRTCSYVKAPCSFNQIHPGAVITFNFFPLRMSVKTGLNE